MGRQPAVAGGRPVVVTIRLSESEAAAMDRARKGLSRSEFGRIAVNARSASPSALKFGPSTPLTQEEKDHGDLF